MAIELLRVANDPADSSVEVSCQSGWHPRHEPGASFRPIPLHSRLRGTYAFDRKPKSCPIEDVPKEHSKQKVCCSEPRRSATPLLMDGYPKNIMVMAAILTIGPSLAVIGAVFFAGDAIAGEFESKTGYMLFTNPVRRTTLVIGKYLASCAAVTLLIIFGYAIVAISLLVIYGEVPLETAKSFGLCLLYAGSVLSVTFFFSALSKGVMGATVITLLFIMVISGTIQSVLMMAGKASWFILTTGGDTIATVYGGYELFLEGVMPRSMWPFQFKSPDIGLSVLSMVIYLVVGFVLSLWITNRRQLA